MSSETLVLEAPEAVARPEQDGWPERGERTKQHDWTDVEAYRHLYVSVIQLAIKDYEFLQRINKQEQLTPSERKKLRGLTEDGDPVEFFASRWFEDICGMIGVHAQAIRERLEIQA